MKSPYTLGHCQGVTGLVEAAAQAMGLKDTEVIALRRTALLHNLGRLAIGNGILDKAGPLNPAEWERMRLYPYHTERVLVRPAAPNRQALSRNGGYSSVTRITA